MKIPMVREWGSWAVFFSSVLAALAAGLMTGSPEKGREFAGTTVLTIVGLTFLINFKNPLASAVRTRGERKEHVLWALFFGVSGILLLVPFLSDGIKVFSVFSVLMLSYVILISRGKEHHLLTELNGFALLTLSAPVVYFTVTGELSQKLYAAVLLFFSAGVFKVRVRIRKTMKYRLIMVCYCALAAVIYYILDISLLILLPFMENIISAVKMKEEKLRVTGYTELVKGIVFIILVGLLWK